MTTTISEIRLCPYCIKEYISLIRTSRSYYSGDVKYFTDGFNSLKPYEKVLGCCPYCHGFLWPDKIKKIKEIHWSSIKHKELAFEKSNGFVHVIAMVKSAWRTREEEKTIRIIAWHYFSRIGTDNFFATHFSGHPSYTSDGYYIIHNPAPYMQSNRIALLDLLDESNLRDGIMKAELYRHLCKFFQSIKLLEQCKKMLKNKTDLSIRSNEIYGYKKWMDTIMNFSKYDISEVIQEI